MIFNGSTTRAMMELYRSSLHDPHHSVQDDVRDYIINLIHQDRDRQASSGINSHEFKSRVAILMIRDIFAQLR